MEKKPFHRRLLDGWLVIAGHFGEVQTLVLLGLIYTFVIGPASIGAGLIGRRDFLAKKKLRLPESAWLDADSRPAEIEAAKQPF